MSSSEYFKTLNISNNSMSINYTCIRFNPPTIICTMEVEYNANKTIALSRTSSYRQDHAVIS